MTDSHDPTGQGTRRDLIQSLRVEGRFAEALMTARDDLAERRSVPTAKPFEIGDAERLVATLERVVTMSGEDRVTCARADALTDDIEAAVGVMRFREALVAAETQLALREKLLGRRHVETARSLDAMGHAQLELNDLASAGPVVEELLAIRRALLEPEHPETAMALLHAGGVCWRRADLVGAERLVREAVQMWRRVYEEHPSLARGVFSLGRVVHETGRFAEAEPLYRVALTMQRRLDPDDAAIVPLCMIHLARLYITQGDDDAGDALLREAMTICDRLGDRAMEAGRMAIHTMVGALAWRGAHDEADLLRQESLKRTRRVWGDRHLTVANGLHEWGQSLLKRRRFKEAEALFRQAIDIRRETFGASHPTMGASLLELSRALAGQGDREAAMPEVRAALALGREMGVMSRPLATECLIMIGDLERLDGDPTVSEATLLEAARRFEIARAQLRHGAARAAFAASPYPSLALTQLELGCGDEAWRTMERGRGRVLSDVVIDSPRSAFPPNLRELEATRLRELADAESRLQELARPEPDSAGVTGDHARRLATCRQRLAEAELAWSQFHATLMRRQTASGRDALELSQVQRALDSEQAIIGWFDVARPGLDPEAWGYVVRSNGPVRWVRLDAGGDPSVRALAEDYRASMRRRGQSALGDSGGDDMGAIEDELFRRRVAPLLAEVEDTSSWIVIAAGDLVGVPVESLLVRRVGTLDVASSYSPSAALHTWLTETRSRGRRRKRERMTALLVGDPPFRAEHVDVTDPGGAHHDSPAPNHESDRKPAVEDVLRGHHRFGVDALPRLQGSRVEVDRVGAFFADVVTLVGSAASEEALRTRASHGTLREFDVLHIATHALVNASRPELSALVLSQVDLPNPRDAALAGEPVARGMLTARDIVHTWDLDAELVVLSACDSGTGRHVAGEGLVGFVHAFMQAGARALLVSLWPIEDRATQLLMERFYACWIQDGLRKPEALREAKCWLREWEDTDGKRPYAHPFYWSPFILFGDAS